MTMPKHQLGIEVTEHISTAHRLPPTRKIQNGIIVKLVHRNMKEKDKAR
jgi:hypothetical protein